VTVTWSMILGYGYVWSAGLDERGRIIDQVTVTVADRTGPDGGPARETRLRRVDVSPASAQAGDSPAGPAADTVALPTCSPRVVPKTSSFVGYDATGRAMGFMGVPFLAGPKFAMGLDGTLWCTGSDEYVIVHRTIGSGDTLHVIRGTYAAVPVTQRERDDAIASANTFLSRYARRDLDASVIPATKPIIERIDVDRAGNVWVRRTAATTNGLNTWEVYDARGRRVATATAAFSPRTGVPLFITEREMYVVVTDGDGVPSVVRAKITHDSR